jgi:PKD repeat protein
VIANNAVNVTSNDPIALYFSEEASGPRNDNSFALPDTVLGNDYYVMSYEEFGSTSEFMVIAPGSTVRVEVTPSAITFTGHAAGVPFDTTLIAGQVFQLQSTSDLSGSRVRSLDPAQKFAVIGANALGSVGCNNTVDPLFEQLLPTSSWGMNYVVISTPNSDDICRILASQNGTVININNGAVATVTLNAGQYYDATLSPADPFFINATSPISVARILQTEYCNNNPHTLGDPDLIMVDANEQMFLDSITFYANNIEGINVNYVTVVIRTPDTSTVVLDGANVQDSFLVLPANPAYSYANMTIPAGYHQITTTGTGFLAYMCGLGSPTSTGCAAGVYVIPPSFALSASFTPLTCAGNNNGAATVTATGGTPPYTYLWSPGGQTTQIITGLAAGTYVVTVTDRAAVTNVDTVTITQPPPLNAGTIMALHDTVCAGTVGRLTVTGNAGSVQWQSSVTPGNFTNITGATSTAYASLISKTTYFRVYTASGNCADTSASFKLTAVPAPVISFTSTNAGQQTISYSSNGSSAGDYFWDFDDGENSTETNPSHTYDTAGTYHVCLTITNNTNCTFTLCQNVTVYPTGINNLDVEDEIEVYPNPFGGSIFIDGKELNAGISNVTVYDLLGRIVFSQFYDAQRMIEVPLFNLSAGMYYLGVKTGDTNYFQPIIKQ